MSEQLWQETLVSQDAAGTLFNTYTTSKTIINPQALYTTTANKTFKPGKKFSILVQGAISNVVTTPGTITFEVKIGSVIAFTTGAIQLSTTAHTTLPFWLEIMLTCRAVGSSTSANLMGQGRIESICVARTAVADGTQTHTVLTVPTTAPAVGTGFDTTIANIWDLWAGFSINDAGNGVQIQQYEIVARN